MRPMDGGRRRRCIGSPPRDAVPAEVRLYDHLFSRPDPGADDDLLADLNPDSETVLHGALVESSLADAAAGDDRPVRAPGLLRRRSRFAPGSAGVQPDADAQGHLGQDPGPVVD